ncbi:MAG: hypothetical protein EAZ27_11940, partial [Cytophagales bacterium]
IENSRCNLVTIFIKYGYFCKNYNNNHICFKIKSKLKSLPITTKGESSVSLKANELFAGIFVYTLVADGNIIDSKRMVIVE